jgi:uncharacterized damage-inducible protein DinB
VMMLALGVTDAVPVQGGRVAPSALAERLAIVRGIHPQFRVDTGTMGRDHKLLTITLVLDSAHEPAQPVQASSTAQWTRSAIHKESNFMSQASSKVARSRGRFVAVLVCGGLALVTWPTAARAGQDAMTKESAAAVKAAFIADLDVMRDKYLGLAGAFPTEKYTWRPMEGVRSVSEVLMLIASEGYGFAPTSLGGQAALSREEMGKLNGLTDKTQVIDHLTKAFAHAKRALEAIDPATLVGKRRAMGQDRSTPEIVMFVAGDMHEHLGQLIAYARMNHIVPPWSK